ncbi:MAG: hypothetical protein R2684_11745 [Pyrinomonadaceae bacterium]
MKFERVLWLFLGLSLLLSFSAVAFAQSEADMEEDAEMMEELYKRVFKIGDFRVYSMSDSIGNVYPKFQKKLAQFDEVMSIRESNKAFVDGFLKKYGGGETETYKAVRNINKKFEDIEIEGVGDHYELVVERFGWLDTSPDNNAKETLDFVKTGMEYISALNQIYKVRAIDEYRRILRLVPEFSSNERYERRMNRMLEEANELAVQLKKEEEEILSKRSWPNGVSSTSAGTPAALSSAGLNFLNGQSDWGGNTKRETKILKVTIKGDWFVAERTLIGTPLRYGLPAYVAVSDNSLPADQIIVYEVTFVTKNPKMETNFLGVWVGDVWNMYKKNLP